MKSPAIVIAAAACLGLGACAGTPGRSLAGRQGMDRDLDVVKVASVNQWAIRRGATVMWINYPTRTRAERPSDG